MRRGVVVVAGIAAVVAAAVAARAAVSPTVVVGTVVLDPARPVCRPGAPCTRPLPHFKLVFSRRGAVVARVQTNRRGHYHVNLTPGVYRVTAPGHVATGPGAGLSPKQVSIPAASRAKRNFRYDAGIR